MKYAIIFCFLLNNISAENIIDMFDEGNSFMEAKDYSAAIDNFNSIIEIDPYQSKVFYNLGNAYFRIDSLGYAVWAYSKALQISPRDKNCIYNLNLTKDRLNGQITYPKKHFFSSMLFKIRNSITFAELMFLSSTATASIFILNFIFKIFSFNINFRNKIIKFFVLSAIILHVLSIDSYFLNKKKEAILIEKFINIYSEPFSLNGRVLSVVNEGTRIQLLNSQGSWSEVILDNGEKGWIPNSSFLELDK